MKAFLICFILTPLFTYLAQKQFEKKDRKGKVFGIIFSVFALIIPCIIAGVRSIDVGRDIEMYVTPTFKSALQNDFFTFMANAENEVGYSIFIYYISLFTDNLYVVLSMIQLYTILFIYLFAYKKREEIPMWLVMTIYLLSWYCITYTMMRQSMAVAILILSTVYFQKKEYGKTALLFLLALSFHVTAVLGLVVYFIMYVFNEKQPEKIKKVVFWGILILLFFTTIFYKQILYILTNVIQILPDRFYEYAQKYTTGKNYTNYSELLFKLFWLFCGIMYKYLTRNSKNEKANVILMLLSIDFTTFIISLEIVNMGRAGYYFFYLAMFYLIPELVGLFKKKNNKILVNVALIAVLFIFWFWKFPVNSYCDTYPYKSEILTFLN